LQEAVDEGLVESYSFLAFAVDRGRGRGWSFKFAVLEIQDS